MRLLLPIAIVLFLIQPIKAQISTITDSLLHQRIAQNLTGTPKSLYCSKTNAIVYVYAIIKQSRVDSIVFLNTSDADIINILESGINNSKIDDLSLSGNLLLTFFYINMGQLDSDVKYAALPKEAFDQSRWRQVKDITMVKPFVLIIEYPRYRTKAALKDLPDCQ